MKKVVLFFAAALLFGGISMTKEPSKGVMKASILEALKGKAEDGKACHVYGKIKFVDYGEDYEVKFVDYGEDLKVKYVDYGADEAGKWEVVDYGEDFKIKLVDYGEDFSVKEVDYGEGCD